MKSKILKSALLIGGLLAFPPIFAVTSACENLVGNWSGIVAKITNGTVQEIPVKMQITKVIGPYKDRFSVDYQVRGSIFWENNVMPIFSDCRSDSGTGRIETFSVNTVGTNFKFDACEYNFNNNQDPTSITGINGIIDQTSFVGGNFSK